MTKLACSSLVTLSAFTAVAFVQESRARACSAPLPGVVTTRQIIPADGSTDVPTNARILISYEGSSGGVPDHPNLRGPDGADVPATFSIPVGSSGIPSRATYLLVPSAPLKANTRYTVLSDYAQLPCVENNLAIIGAGSNPMCFPTTDGGTSFGGDAGVPPTNAVSSFTTGAGPDTTPPTLSGSLTYTVGARSTCTAGACCGPYDALTVGFNWDRSANAGTTLVYELSDAKGVVLMPVPDSPVGDVGPTAGTLYGAYLCSGLGGAGPAMVNGTRFFVNAGTYTVVAVDVAGNRSQPIGVNVAVDCSAGVDAGVDSGPSDGPTDARVIPDVLDKPDRSPLSDVDLGVTVDGAADLGAIDSNDAYAGFDSRPDVVIDVPHANTGGAGGSSGTGGQPSAGGVAGGSGQHQSSSDSGCSCHVGGVPSSGAGLVVLAFGLMLAVSRRRSRK